MILRRRLIGFRITATEEALYLTILQEHPSWTWSDLVRMALEDWATRHSPTRPITTLNTRSPVKHDAPLFAKKRGAKKGKKKMPRKAAKVA